MEAKLLLMDFVDIFAKNDMDLDRTSLVKHKITLKDTIAFKERYRRIPLRFA